MDSSDVRLWRLTREIHMILEEQASSSEAGGNLALSKILKGLLEFNKNEGLLVLQETAVKRGLKLIDGLKKAELDEEWKELRSVNAEFHLLKAGLDEQELQLAGLERFERRTALIRDQARLILEAYKLKG